MAQIIPAGRSRRVVGLDTYNHTALSSTVYSVNVQVDEVPASGITITIKQNSSTIVTSAVPAAGQSSVFLQAKINATASDVIGIVLASSSVIDTEKNNVKATLNIRTGMI